MGGGWATLAANKADTVCFPPEEKILTIKHLPVRNQYFFTDNIMSS
jgi:hypothetical protein